MLNKTANFILVLKEQLNTFPRLSKIEAGKKLRCYLRNFVFQIFLSVINGTFTIWLYVQLLKT